MSNPTISVSLVAYNHERYVAAAIESVLAQDFADFELIIVDDGSTDRTPEIIANYTDPRITSIRRPNGGPSVATNTAIERCRGQYVALMAGDDISTPNRLSSQLAEYRRGGRRVLFSICDFIDDDGNPPSGSHHGAHSFDTTIRTQAQTYRKLFDGNFVTAATTFTERAVFDEIGPYDPSLYLLQDYQLWVNVTKKYPLAFQNEVLLHYRVRSGHGNLSAPTRATWTRYDNECYLIIRDFFDGTDEALFREAFAADLKRPDLTGPAATACEQAFLLLESTRPELRFVGMERFRDLYRDATTSAMLTEQFGYRHAQFVNFIRSFDSWNRYIGQESALYIDSGSGFHAGECVRCFARHEPHFRASFELADLRRIRRLRWDPVEGRMGSVQLKHAWYDTADGECTIDLRSLESNGRPAGLGAFDFDTLDPWIELPVEPGAIRLNLEGTWQIPNAEVALAQMTGWQPPAPDWQRSEERRLIAELRRELDELRQRTIFDRLGRVAKRGYEKCRGLAVARR